jgi:hypothetical protein
MRERPQDYSMMMLRAHRAGLSYSGDRVSAGAERSTEAKRRIHRVGIPQGRRAARAGDADARPHDRGNDAEGSGDVQPMIRSSQRNNRPAISSAYRRSACQRAFQPTGCRWRSSSWAFRFPEALLFQVGDAYQRITDWHTRAPRI